MKRHLETLLGRGLLMMMGAMILARPAHATSILLEAPSAGGSYWGMYLADGIAASFTFAAAEHVSTIDVVLRTPASTTFTTFDFSLQNALTGAVTVFANEALTAPVGVVSTEAMNVNQTLLPGTYYLVGVVPGYAGTPVTPGDVDGWLLSTGVYNDAAGVITNGVWEVGAGLDAGHPAPAFTVNGTASAVPEPSTMLLLSTGVVATARRWRTRRQRD